MDVSDGTLDVSDSMVCCPVALLPPKLVTKACWHDGLSRFYNNMKPNTVSEAGVWPGDQRSACIMLLCCQMSFRFSCAKASYTVSCG